MSEQYCVMNVQKQHRQDVSGLEDEANREYENKDAYKNEVDLSRSHKNVYLVSSDDWHSSINEVLEAHGVKEQKNSVVLLTSVYTASPEWFAEHTEEEVAEYFDACLEHARTRGEVISAVIHYDETTPHMHVAAVPIADVPDKKAVPVPMTDEDGNVVYQKDEDGNDVLDEEGQPVPVQAVYTSGKSKGQKKWKRVEVKDADGNAVTHKGLNAAYIIGNKVKMSKEQTRFWKEVGESFGMVRGEIRVEDKEEAAHRKSEAEYKAGKIVEGAERERDAIIVEAEMRRELTEIAAEVELEQMGKRVEELEKQRDAAVSEMDAARHARDAYAGEEFTVKGGGKAKGVKGLQAERAKLKADNEQLEEANKTAKETLDGMNDEIVLLRQNAQNEIEQMRKDAKVNLDKELEDDRKRLASDRATASAEIQAARDARKEYERASQNAEGYTLDEVVAEMVDLGVEFTAPKRKVTSVTGEKEKPSIVHQAFNVIVGWLGSKSVSGKSMLETFTERLRQRLLQKRSLDKSKVAAFERMEQQAAESKPSGRDDVAEQMGW